MGIAFIVSLEYPERHEKVMGRAKPITQGSALPILRPAPSSLPPHLPASQFVFSFDLPEADKCLLAYGEFDVLFFVSFGGRSLLIILTLTDISL